MNEIPLPMERMFGKRTLTRILDISEAKLNRMLAAGTAPRGYRIGNVWRWDMPSVREWLDTQAVGGERRSA